MAQKPSPAEKQVLCACWDSFLHWPWSTHQRLDFALTQALLQQKMPPFEKFDGIFCRIRSVSVKPKREKWLGKWRFACRNAFLENRSRIGIHGHKLCLNIKHYRFKNLIAFSVELGLCQWTPKTRKSWKNSVLLEEAVSSKGVQEVIITDTSMDPI